MMTTIVGRRRTGVTQKTARRSLVIVRKGLQMLVLRTMIRMGILKRGTIVVVARKGAGAGGQLIVVVVEKGRTIRMVVILLMKESEIIIVVRRVNDHLIMGRETMIMKVSTQITARRTNNQFVIVQRKNLFVRMMITTTERGTKSVGKIIEAHLAVTEKRVIAVRMTMVKKRIAIAIAIVAGTGTEGHLETTGKSLIIDIVMLINMRVVTIVARKVAGIDCRMTEIDTLVTRIKVSEWISTTKMTKGTTGRKAVEGRLAVVGIGLMDVIVIVVKTRMITVVRTQMTKIFPMKSCGLVTKKHRQDTCTMTRKKIFREIVMDYPRKRSQIQLKLMLILIGERKRTEACPVTREIGTLANA